MRLQALGRRLVEGHALGLAMDAIRRNTEPGEVVRNPVGKGPRRAFAIGVVEAEDETAALASGKQPVEQRRAQIADMNAAGGRRGETDGDGHSLAA